MLTPPETIGHLITIHPSQDKAFCLQLLLLHQKGHKTWEDVCTIEGVVYPTYKAACIALDLIENDSICIESVEEACQIHLPPVCQSLFIFILTECLPSQPSVLFEKFSGFLTYDYLHQQLHDGYDETSAKNLPSMICYVILRQHSMKKAKLMQTMVFPVLIYNCDWIWILKLQKEIQMLNTSMTQIYHF